MSATNPDTFHRLLTELPEISKQSLLAYSSAEALDLAGVAYAALMDPKISAKVKPVLQWGEVGEFLRVYYSRCIALDIDSVWADSRYSACWDAANWLAKAHELGLLDGDELALWIDWVRDIYVSGDADVQLAVETGFLEHVLSNVGLSKAFADLKNDQIMAGPYLRSLASLAGEAQ